MLNEAINAVGATGLGCSSSSAVPTTMTKLWTLPYLLFLFVYPLFTNAQDFTVPSGWRKPTSSASRDQRVPLIQGLIDSVSSDFNKTSGLFNSYTITQTGSFMAAAANSEFITNSTRNRNIVLDGINTYLSFATKGGYNSLGAANNDPPTWGIAAMDAYRAYGDDQALQHAILMWNFTYPYFVTPEHVIAGKHPKKNITLVKTCNGATTAGGMFSTPDIGDGNVNSETIGTWLSLSARLYEQTKDPKYQTAAQLSAQFIQNHLYNGIIIQDTISLIDCNIINNVAISYNSGFAIDGYAVMASTDNSWTPFLNQLISSATPFSVWTRATSGINYEGSSTPNDVNSMWPKSVLMRALWEAWYRSTNGSAVNNYIESYLTVQWNALQDLASVSGANIYSSTWEGPEPTSKNAVAQMSVLDVLNAAVSFVPPPTSDNSTSSLSSSGSVPSQTGNSSPVTAVSHKKTNTGAIVGGVVGGVAFLGILLAALFFFYRQGHTQGAQYDGPDMFETLPIPYNPRETTNSIPQSHDHYDPLSELTTSSVPYPPPTTSESRSQTDEKLSSSQIVLSPTSELSSQPQQLRSPLSNSTSSLAGLTTTSRTIVEPAIRPLPLTPDQARAQPQQDVQADIANYPGLVDTINRLLQRLPTGAQHSDEPPPSYGTQP
ncbi:hypothetical protein BDY19DRAFT_1096014 [Irpex rosettiformis]|uniref:Uncharacterized protein n=1 Tax=Irpex rosettiformis TaxID=378272 RepID=A0ACB8TRC2_9APHY|nr:hypothetical protein BDY19DRAFT_1096014 [Irpex rosettiformis]